MAYEDKARKIAKMLYDMLIANKTRVVDKYQDLADGEELVLRLRFHIQKTDSGPTLLRTVHECIRKGTGKDEVRPTAFLEADDLNTDYLEDSD